MSSTLGFAQGGVVRGRPRRKVRDHGGVYTLDADWWFSTTDRCLAEAVRRELDRIDPLPCAGHEPIDISRLMDAQPRTMCRWCAQADGLTRSAFALHDVATEHTCARIHPPRSASPAGFSHVRGGA